MMKVKSLVLIFWFCLVGAAFFSCTPQQNLIRYVPADAYLYLQAGDLEGVLEEADQLYTQAGLKKQMQNLSVADLLKTGMLAVGARLDWFDLSVPAGLAWVPGEAFDDTLFLLPMAAGEDYEYIAAFFKKNGGLHSRREGKYAFIRMDSAPNTTVLPETPLAWENPAAGDLSLYINVGAILAREDLDFHSLLLQLRNNPVGSSFFPGDFEASLWISRLDQAGILGVSISLKEGRLSLKGELGFNTSDAAADMLQLLVRTVSPGKWESAFSLDESKIRMNVLWEQQELVDSLKMVATNLPALIF